MKAYTVTVDIDLPRDRVVELFDNFDNLPKWQNGLQSVEHLSGEPGRPGAKTRMVYLNGRHRIELTETITENDLPDAFNGRYEWAGGANTLHNRFLELGPNETRWESRCEYRLTAFMPRVIGFLFPGLFRRQNQKFLDNFKAFCEEGRDVSAGDDG